MSVQSRIIALKSKQPSAKSSHQIEISQSTYNVNEISGFYTIGVLGQKTFLEKLQDSGKYLYRIILAILHQRIQGRGLVVSRFPANISCFPRRLEDVFSVKIFHLPSGFQDVFKTRLHDLFQRRFQDVFARRVQDVFKTNLQDVQEDKKLLH